MSGPYAKASTEWLRDNERFFREVLDTAGRHAAQLRKLESAWSPGGEHLLDFLDVKRPDLERALAVCERLMQSLGPTAQAMRDELGQRGS
jgi:hypothetical protein